MKVYLNSPKENWIVDRFVKEWKKYNKQNSTNFIKTADIVWIISPWTYKKLSKKVLKTKKVLSTIHHIDENKFNIEEFKKLDKCVDYYHVISLKTETVLKKLTNKKIFYAPFWIDPQKWFEIENKTNLRRKYNLDEKKYLVGSFQRDTESKGKLEPKLEKGPDQFLDIIIKLNQEKEDLHVVLAGKKREFLVNKFKEYDISFTYYEMVSQKKLNELYNILNLYIVSSRVEGGPQAILECALTKTPIISTDVGIADEVLSTDSIFNMNNFLEAVPNIEYAFKKVQKFLIPNGFDIFYKILNEVYEN